MIPDVFSTLQGWDFYRAMWKERDWMLRRVDRVSLVDRNRIQLNITFAVDARIIRELLSKSGLADSGMQQIPLPLFLWKKEPVLDVDNQER